MLRTIQLSGYRRILSTVLQIHEINYFMTDVQFNRPQIMISTIAKVKFVAIFSDIKTTNV